MARTDLVVPARLVSDLRVPSLSVTTGGAEVQWVELPTGRWRFHRRPAQRLPLDPRSARLARRYLRIERWAALVRLVTFLAWATVGIATPWAPPLPITLTVWLTLALCSIPRVAGRLPRQAPSRNRAGDLRIPDVPTEVATQWLTLNPGVTATNDPPPRPRSRRWYATWSTITLASAIALISTPEDSTLIWIAALTLCAIGVTTALKTLPPGYISFEGNE